MSTGVLLIALSAGCSSGSKPNPAPASSGSPTVAATQPTTQPTVGSGPVVTLTSKEGYVYKLQASPYTGPAITVLDYANGGGTGNAPPGKVFAAVTVTISDGLPDRAEPLGPLFYSGVGGLTVAVPADSAAAFGPAAHSIGADTKACYHNNQTSSAWCDLTAQPSQGTSQPGELGPLDSTSQLEPGQPVSFILASAYPIPQAAPMAKLALFAQLGLGNLVQVPLTPSG
jgi:hypothetical protein